MEPTIDVVIPVKNNLKGKNFSIFFTLKSVLFQKKVSTNIFVIDDHSDDGTVLAILQEFKQYKNIKVLNSKVKGGIASTRNFGSKCGNAPFILFIDDDTFLSENLLLHKTIEEAYNYDFACGAVRYWTTLQWSNYLLKEDTYRSWLNILKKISFIPKGVDRITGLMDLTHISFLGNYGLIKRDVFERLNGYPETYNGWGIEDTHLMYVLCINGYDYQLLKDKNLFVYHLNHTIDKQDAFLKNLDQFRNYQKQVGIEFCESAFFDEFDGILPVLQSSRKSD